MATRLSLYQEAIRLFGDARLDVTTDDTESRYALDDAWDSAITFCLRAAPWRFANTGVPLQEIAIPETEMAPGFTIAYQKPPGHLRTLALYVLNGALQRPIDIREYRGRFYANQHNVIIQEIDSSYADPETNSWPEHFAKAVAAQLAFQVADRLTNSATAGVRMAQLYGSLMQEAILHDADPEDPWLRHQLDGSFQEGVHYVMAQGPWRFALAIDPLPEDPASPRAPGFSITYDKPRDHLRTHALFVVDGELERPVDVREYREHLHANQHNIFIRHISAEFDNPVTGRWPEPFLTALLAYLQLGDVPDPRAAPDQQQPARQQSFRSILANALALEGEPEDPWLRHQLDGTYQEGVHYVMAQGPWRFALVVQSLAEAPAPPETIAAGYSVVYQRPVGWLRTHALYTIDGELERPVDIRENLDRFYSTHHNVFIRHISAEFDNPVAAKWPEPFLDALLTYLQLGDVPDPRIRPDQQQPNRGAATFRDVLTKALQLEAEPEDEWLRHQLDGSFREGMLYLLEQGYWRFALRTIELQAGIGPAPAPDVGFPYGYAQPADWLRSHALFIPVGDGGERPVDIKEAGGLWSTTASLFAARFISKDLGSDPLRWPEPFLAALLAWLRLRDAPADQPDSDQPQTAVPIFQRALETALGVEAEPEDEWLRHQLDGSFREGLLYLLEQGYWRFALKTIELQAGVGGPALIPDVGFPYAYAQPADWLRSHALFVPMGDGREHPVDIKEAAGRWSTTANYFVARFVSVDLGRDSRHWPQPFLTSLLAWLKWRDASADNQQQTTEPIFERSLMTALAAEAEPEDSWLRYQLDGSFHEGLFYLLTQGFWRFALASVASANLGPEPGLTYAFRVPKPPDWLRTHQLFIAVDPGNLERPFDVREHHDRWTTDAPSFVVRYLSIVSGQDPYRWPEPFLAALLAYLTPTPAAPQERQRSAAAPAQDMPFLGALQAALATEAEPEDEWLRYQLDGSFQEALLYVLAQGSWRFALQASAAADLGPTPGVIYHFRIPKPANWLRTHQLFISIDPGNFERPFDIREHENHWTSNKDNFIARYVSTGPGLDPTRWPDPFLATIMAYLTTAPAERQNIGKPGSEISPFLNILNDALAIEADPEDPWLRHQLDGSFQEALLYVLAQGFWRFALASVASADLNPTPGEIYDFRIPKPADWLRTHQLFITIDPGNFERPFDIREHHGRWTSNQHDFIARYVSTNNGFDPERWPETFLDAILAYLTAPPETVRKDNPDQGTRFATALADALAIESEPEDEWLSYQLDGSFQEALHYVLVQGFWRFALASVASADLGPTPGEIYHFRIPKPADWLRTHQLFISIDPGNFERPFDIREHHNHWTSNKDTFVARYISSNNGFDPKRWPEAFLTAVLAYLTAAPAERQNPRAPGTEATSFIGILANALEVEAEPEDEWLEYQLDGSFQEGLHYVLAQGYWSFALKTVEFTAAPPGAVTAAPIIGYPYTYPQPVDMLRTHAYFVPAGDGREYPIDIKEDGSQWSTTANYFAVRYVSSGLGFVPAAWPESFLKTLHAYLELNEEPDTPPQTSRTGQPIPAVAIYKNLLESSLAIEGEPENPWYRFQRTGAFLRAVFHTAESGRWRFAIDTLNLEADAWIEQENIIGGTLPANVFGSGQISPSYSAVFAKPNDWLRTLHIYHADWHGHMMVDSEVWPNRRPIDFRDELGNWHCNYKNIQVRYIKRAAIESWRWPQSYADAVLAWLEYEELRTDPKQVAAAAGKLHIYEDAIDKAAKSDDSQEFPPYRTVGRLVRGRFSRGHGVGAMDFRRF